MAKVTVKYDPQLEQSEIIAQIDNGDQSQVPEEKNYTELQQTAIYGIQCPIIAVNNVMISYEDIISFDLDDTGHMPVVNIHIFDRKSFISKLDTPNECNELRVQILPPFDDVYEKINLTFFITNFKMGARGDLYITGTYKISDFTSSQFKSFGEISTYNLFNTIASECKLGFSTNVEDEDDKRFVYCPFKSYKSTIEREISHSGSETVIYDWWIDAWNYMNLVDMYDRYNAIDSDDDMKIWVSAADSEVTEGSEIKPQETKAEFTNLWGSNESQLYVKAYRKITNTGVNVLRGTDKIYSVYSMKDRTYEDTSIEYKNEKGESLKDKFNNFEYKGEVYGEYDYITNGMYRGPFFQRMNNEHLEIDLDQPMLGVLRGNRLNFACYYNNDMYNTVPDKMDEEGLLENVSTNVPMEEIGEAGQSDAFRLDKSVSGQYLITGNKYHYSDRHWTQTVMLVRPHDQNPKMLKEE